MAIDPVPPVPLERLLDHRAWVRSLARALVRDPWDADDLEQELWLASIQNPPEEEGAVRRWFRTVAGHAAGRTRRGESRRRAREEASARPEAVKSTAEVVAEAEALRRVVVAVMDLEEPYRATILLRWYEDLGPAAIAQRQGVPVETVRTRLRRAVERLRERFDAESGGDRKAWTLALLPLTSGGSAMGPAGTAGPAGGSGVAAGTGAAAAATLGGLLMAKKAAALIAAAVVVLAGVAWWTVVPVAGPESGGSAGSPIPGGSSIGAAPERRAGKAAPTMDDPSSGAPGIPAGETLEVRVRGPGGAPLAGVRVAVHPRPESVESANYLFVSATAPSEPPAAIASGMTDAAGVARLGNLEPGARLVGTTAAGWAVAWRPVHLVARETREPLVITLVPACSLTGRVLDAGGAPVAGIAIVAAGPAAWKVNSAALARCSTDTEGRYRLEGLEPGANSISAWTSAGVRQGAGWLLLPGVTSFDIRLGRGVTLRGRILDDASGQALPGAQVVAWATRTSGNGVATAAATTDREGRFEFPGFPASILVPLNVGAPGYLPYPDSPEYAVERVGIQLSAGTAVEREIRLKKGTVLGGRVTDAAGNRVPGAFVTVVVRDQQVARANTDLAGAFRIVGLPTGPATVSAWAGGWAPAPTPGGAADPAGSGKVSTELTLQRETSLDFVLQPCPAVFGRVLDGEGRPVEGARLAATTGGGSSSSSAADGSFQILAMAGEGCIIEASASGGRRGRSAPFAVDPVRETRGIEIRIQPGATIAGRLRRADGNALDSAEVRLVDAVPDAQQPWQFESAVGASERLIVDADGAFRAEGLLPGPRTLLGSAAGCPPTLLAVEALGPGETREGLELRLQAGTMLEGRVAGAAGGTIPGAEITVITEERALTGRLDSRISAVTDAEGRFRCGPLPAVPHRISVRAAGFLPGSATAVPGADGTTVVLAPALSIAGTVVDEEDGHPIPGVTVAAIPSSVAGPYWSGLHVSTGADGTFRIEGVEAGTYRVRACVDWTGNDYMETEIGGVVAGTGDLRIQARKGLAIGGRVGGPTGGPAPGVPEVRVRRKTPEGASPDFGRSGRVRADGSFRIGGLVPGNYELWVDDHSGTGKALFPRVVMYSVAAGTTDLVIKVAAGLRISGRLQLEDGTAPGESLSIQIVASEGGIVEIVNAAADGSFQSPPLPEGVPHNLFADAPEGWTDERALQVLPGKADVVITFAKGKTLEGRVVDENGEPVPAGVPVGVQAGGNGVTTEGGLFAVPGLKDRPYRVRAGGPPSDFAPAWAEGKHAPGASGVIVRVRRGVSVSGRILAADGTGQRRLQVTASTEETDAVPGAWGQATTDDDGAFSFRGLPPGPVRIKVLHPLRGDVDLGNVQAPGSGFELRLPE